MARFRLSGPAKSDIAAILTISRERHGGAAQVRYRALMSAALRRIAADPVGPATTDRADVSVGMRSFHIRHTRETGVARPVHVIFYRQADSGLVEIVRILHDRMDAGRHIGSIDPPAGGASQGDGMS